MPMKYKVDVLSNLKAAGYSTYSIRKDRLLSESTVQKLRGGEPISWENIETVCRLLNCQPGDILEYADGDERTR
jgi:putative transcriptional regulator